MPNIEIHGVTDDLSYGQLYSRIVECLHNMPGAGEIVITGMRSEVLDLNFQKQPFLRVLWTPETSKEDLDDVERRLCSLEPPIDLEFLPLARYKSAKEIKFEREKALETLRGLRPVAGTDPNFDYEKGQLKSQSGGDPLFSKRV